MNDEIAVKAGLLDRVRSVGYGLVAIAGLMGAVLAMPDWSASTFGLLLGWFALWRRKEIKAGRD